MKPVLRLEEFSLLSPVQSHHKVTYGHGARALGLPLVKHKQTQILWFKRASLPGAPSDTHPIFYVHTYVDNFFFLRMVRFIYLSGITLRCTIVSKPSNAIHNSKFSALR